MATIYFFEKPGCANNARQKKLLAGSGHTVIAKNILTHHWTGETLAAFFGSRPVHSWFNRASPRIKSGEIVPEKISSEEALAFMLKDPLLIRRPLMQVEDRCEAGFDPDLVHAWIGLSEKLTDPETCLRIEDK
ncbi:MAG: hypothetical protein K2P57_02725 [Burkholderiales bacterium]|nr:hypothetical protein [Burkholderiales bacterium]